MIQFARTTVLVGFLLGCASARPPGEGSPKLIVMKVDAPGYLAWNEGAFVPVDRLGNGRVRSLDTREEWTGNVLKVIRPERLEPKTRVYFARPGQAHGFQLGTVEEVGPSGTIRIDHSEVPLADVLVDDCPGGMVGGAGERRFSECP